ncbi:hypothetical protein MKEN_00737600 [Mycena kentingensis (nom. inval.)]|nr:hypothetical protein MKEN_00737600 [Mycena kentingensis (nom. inval.)]
MQLTRAGPLVLIATLATAIHAAPASLDYTLKRDDPATCSIDVRDLYDGLTIVAAANDTLNIRWDMFGTSAENIEVGDIVWFDTKHPNEHEVFTAVLGGNTGYADGVVNFLLQDYANQAVGISGPDHKLSNDTAAMFKVLCQECHSSADLGQLVGKSCTFEEVDPTLNGNGQCVVFNGVNTVAKMEQCESGKKEQQFNMYAAAVKP